MVIASGAGLIHRSIPCKSSTSDLRIPCRRFLRTCLNHKKQGDPPESPCFYQCLLLLDFLIHPC